MPQTILVVDDEALIRSLLAGWLEPRGFVVLQASDGDEALRLARRHELGLVIIDILMPGKEGIETIREMKRIRADVKIVAISGGGRIGAAEYLGLARTLGAERALAKPFERDELLEAVDQLLAN